MSESDLDASSGSIADEIQIDGELGNMEMLCRGCDHIATGAELEALEALYYA